VIGENRTELDGSLIKNTTYKYDAASNLIEKVETIPDAAGPEDSPTPTIPEPTATMPPPTATAPPTATMPGGKQDDDDSGCHINAAHGASAWMLLAPLALMGLGRRRSRQKTQTGERACK